MPVGDRRRITESILHHPGEGTGELQRSHIVDVFKWGLPKMRGTFLGVPIIRTIVFWGLYWGLPILGIYQMVLQ